jgi:hypothetical protein
VAIVCECKSGLSACVMGGGSRKNDERDDGYRMWSGEQGRARVCVGEKKWVKSVCECKSGISVCVMGGGSRKNEWWV